jgi:hypothetical protein
MTGHGGSSMRVLYLVAQLCGHVSPSTTLLHYIHLCDLLLAEGLCRNENQPVLSEAIVKNLTGFGRSTCFKLRGEAENWQMISFIDHFADRKGKHLGDPNEANSFKITKRELKIPGNKLDGLPHWETIHKILEELLGHNVPAQDVASRFAVPVEVFQEWGWSCCQMAALKKRGGRSRLGWGDKSYPVAPRLKSDKQEVEQIMNAWECLEDSVKYDLDNTLSHFIHHYRSKSNDILCYDPDTVQRFFVLFKHLKIPRERIRMQYHPGNVGSPDVNDRLQLQQQIALRYGINVSQVVMLSNDVKGKRYTIKESLGMQVLESEMPNQLKQKTPASYGVRYAITLLAIVRCVIF